MAQSIDPSDRPACRPGQPCRLNGLRVLLVDDDATRRQQRTRAFERYGFDVLPAADAQAAVATLRTGQVCDIAVVDLQAGAVRAVTLVNALRGLRAWLPAVVVGSAAPPEAATLTDPGVRTMWVARVESPVALSSAIMATTCPGREPSHCAFSSLIGSARRLPGAAPRPAEPWMALPSRPGTVFSLRRSAA